MPPRVWTILKLLSSFLSFSASVQFLLTNVAAFNAFGLIYIQKKFEFGKYGWKLLLINFGVPFVLSATATLYWDNTDQGSIGKKIVIQNDAGSTKIDVHV